jgi:hypothetical protein
MILDITYKFHLNYIRQNFWIIISVNDALKYGDCVKFWDYVEPKTETLCIEFCAMPYIFKLFTLLNKVRKVGRLDLSRTSLI